MNDLLEYIDSIDTTSVIAECNVINAIMDVYSKEALIMECYHDEYPEWYQEGKTLEIVKNKGKDDSNKLITALLFIPRLLTTIIKSIANKLKTGQLGRRMNVAFKKLAGMKDIEAKEAYCEEVNRASGGQYTAYVDSKGEIKFRSSGSNIIENAITVAKLGYGVYGAVEALKEAKDLPDIEKRIKEINDELKMIESTTGGTSGRLIREKKELRLAELSTMADAIGAVSGTVSGLSGAISTVTNKEQFKLQVLGLSDSKRAKLMNLIHETTTNLSAVSGMITVAIGVSQLALKAADKFLKHGKWAGEAKMDISVADHTMRVFFKDPTNKSDPKAGLTRKGLEVLYPIGKNEDTSSYSARLDKIRLDIGYALEDIAYSDRGKTRAVYTAFETHDVDPKVRDLLKVKDPRSKDEQVYVPFKLKTFIPPELNGGTLFSGEYDNEFAPAIQALYGIFGEGKEDIMKNRHKKVSADTAKADADVIARENAKKNERYENAKKAVAEDMKDMKAKSHKEV